MRTVAEEDESHPQTLVEGYPPGNATQPPLLERQRSVRISKEHGRDADDPEMQFAKIVHATEKNANSISKLADHMEQTQHGRGGYFDTSALAVHFGKMTDLLARNITHMESMSQKQFEHEQRLTAALEDVSTKRREDRVDLAQLSAHLDRVNRSLERSPTPRKDSVRSSAEVTPAIDFSPLVSTLEKVQQAIEQNTVLTAKLLEERSVADAEARYKNQLDLLPISESLEKIREAVDKQNLHTNALLEILRDDKDDSLQTAKANGETLDRILQAQIETREAVEQYGGDVDFEPVAKHMDAIREVTTENTEQIRMFIERQRDPSQSSADARPISHDLDFSPMTERLDRVHATLEKTTSYFQAQSPGTGDAKFLISALSSHLSKIQAVTEQNANAIKAIASNRESAPKPLSGDGTNAAIRETNDRLQALTQVLTEREMAAKPGEDKLEQKIEDTSWQVRELMAEQRTMVHMVREIVSSIKANQKTASANVVIPPPRKVGKKIVGFVYDGSSEVV